MIARNLQVEKGKVVIDHVKKSLLYCPLTQILWRYAKNEAEVNVYYVAIRMKEYIAIVPKLKRINYIFDL